MILIRLWGGLGNQMFQFATAYALALKNNTTVGICQDRIEIAKTSDKFTERKFELANAFDLPKIKFVETDLLNFYGGVGLSLTDRIKRKIGKYDSYQEVDLRFDPSLLRLGAKSLIDGYFQSANYFSAYEKEIKDAFSFNIGRLNEATKSLAKVINVDCLGVHIRRGDYVNNEKIKLTHGACSIEYYQRGFSKLEETGYEKVIIFSDDPNWVRANIETSKEKIVVDFNQGDNAWQDLYLMSKCGQFIIANSSFGWWGAWLSTNADKRVIAPARWFNDDAKNKLTEHLLPSDWERI